jgi:hypothetical protein
VQFYICLILFLCVGVGVVAINTSSRILSLLELSQIVFEWHKHTHGNDSAHTKEEENIFKIAILANLPKIFRGP